MTILDEFEGERWIGHGAFAGHPYKEYAKWLEETVQNLEQKLQQTQSSLAKARVILSGYQKREHRRYDQDYDHVPYGDDDRDR